MKPAYVAILGLLVFCSCLFLISYIPIVWIDEVMFSDAARNLAYTGTYASRLWEQPKTEIFLIGHMPLWQLVLAVWYKLFPVTVFWTRLPGLILYALTGFFFWKYYSRIVKPELAALLVILCIGDKAIFEAARSTRMDILGAALFSALVYSKESKQSPYLLALLCSLLALVHPNFWFAAGIVFISVWAGTRYNFKVFLVAGIPLLMYGIWIFPWLHLIEEQLISNGTDHVETGGDILRRIQDYFYLRYFKWYEIQQILPVVYIYALVAGTLLFASNTSLRVWVILLWIQTLFLMFFTGTFPRYNLPVVLCVWTLLPVLIRKLPQWSLRGKSAGVFSLGCILLALYPLISRSATALLQLDSRDSEKVLNWIKNSLPEKEKSLLCDEAIGYYVQKPNVDFTLIHTKDKFDFSKYPGGVYWLTYDSEPDSGFEKVSEYSCDPGNYPVWLPAPQTYAGLKLYRVKTQKTWDALQP